VLVEKNLEIQVGEKKNHLNALTTSYEIKMSSVQVVLGS